jgi:RNA polymerase sigma-70 factor (ECF subfamily)
VSLDSALESQWLALALKGDAEAFGKLILRYEKSVYRTAYRMVRDRDEAAEITQESMVRAWQNLSRFRGEAPFAGWLSKIAIHLALNRLRERKKFVRPADEEQHEAVMDQGLHEESTPLSDLLNRESRTALEQAIRELPEDFRAPLLLRIYEEYSYEQIAESLSLPLGTVMSRLYRARERLAHRVRELLGG